jgi:hypothetical protein
LENRMSGSVTNSMALPLSRPPECPIRLRCTRPRRSTVHCSTAPPGQPFRCCYMDVLSLACPRTLVHGRDTPIGPWCLVSRCDGCAPGVGVSHTLTTQYAPYCSFILTDTAGTDSVQIHGTLAAAAWARSKRRGPRRTIQRGRGSSRLVREAR